MSENDANKWYHAFLATNYFFPIFGAILADAIWGKYRTIFWLSIVYCFGHFALAMDDTRAGLTVGLCLIAIGSAASSRASRPTWATSSGPRTST